jgi:hypothetical protein
MGGEKKKLQIRVFLGLNFGHLGLNFLVLNFGQIIENHVKT